MSEQDRAQPKPSAEQAPEPGGGQAPDRAQPAPAEPRRAGATQADAAGVAEADPAPGSHTAPNFDLPNFQQVLAEAEAAGIDLLRDVELHVKVELGRTHMLVEDVLALSEGSVVELNKLAGDPVDVYVNDRLVARGEVLVLSENFCVRINEIVSEIPDPDVDRPAHTAGQTIATDGRGDDAAAEAVVKAAEADAAG